MRKLTLGGLTAHVAGGTDDNGGGDGPVIVLLHGFGAPGTDLVPLAKEIAAPAGTRWVFPVAPHVLEMGMPEAFAGRAWWMIDMAALQVAALTRNYDALADQTPEGLPEVGQTLESFLTALVKELGTTTERMVLGGFSQGAMLATDTVLAGHLRFAGLAVVSGTLLSRARWTTQVAACQGCRVFQSHGREDPILPFPLADELRQLFEAAGARHTWVPFSGGHAIPHQVIAGLTAFFRETLG